MMQIHCAVCGVLLGRLERGSRLRKNTVHVCEEHGRALKVDALKKAAKDFANVGRRAPADFMETIFGKAGL